MKWSIILLVVLPIVLASAFNDGEDFERRRRIPMMLPMQFYNRNYDYEDDGDDEMMRKRTFYAPPTAKFQLWRDLVSQPEDEDDSEEIAQLEDDYDYMDRRRRSSLKRSPEETKRGIPFYFPYYNFFNRAGSKRFSLKKKSLLDSFTRDDPSSFGYDKRALFKKKSDEEKRKKKSV